MGDCKFCGKDAGFLSSSHSACKKLNEDGLGLLARLARQALLDETQLAPLNAFVLQAPTSNFIDQAAIKESISHAWEQAVDEFVQDHVIDHKEERRLMQIVSTFGLDPARLNKNQAYTRASMALVLADVMSKGHTTRVSFDGGVPFILKPGEKLVYRFKSTPLFEEKVVREYQHRSQGMSFRIMRGVYYRVGGGKTTPVEHSQIQQVDSGQFGITDKALYFSGSRSSFRIPYDKMISIQPYSDAIGVCRDGARSKTQIFKTNEGWFAYNLIMALSGQQP